MPGHVPIWANFVVYGPILKISNAMCISGVSVNMLTGIFEISNFANVFMRIGNFETVILLYYYSAKYN